MEGQSPGRWRNSAGNDQPSHPKRLRINKCIVTPSGGLGMACKVVFNQHARRTFLEHSGHHRIGDGATCCSLIVWKVEACDHVLQQCQVVGIVGHDDRLGDCP